MISAFFISTDVAVLVMLTLHVEFKLHVFVSDDLIVVIWGLHR